MWFFDRSRQIETLLKLVELRLDRMEWRLELINQQQRIIMDEFDQILQKISTQSTQIDGLRTLIMELKTKLNDALQSINISPAEKAKLTAILDAASANEAKLTDLANAINENTPAEGSDPSAET